LIVKLERNEYKVIFRSLKLENGYLLIPIHHFPENNGQIPEGSKRWKINGIIGTKRLLCTTYLLVICDKQLVGKLFDKDSVYRVKNFLILPFQKLDVDRKKVPIFIS
jgi:hypothetical protein